MRAAKYVPTASTLACSASGIDVTSGSGSLDIGHAPGGLDVVDGFASDGSSGAGFASAGGSGAGFASPGSGAASLVP